MKFIFGKVALVQEEARLESEEQVQRLVVNGVGRERRAWIRWWREKWRRGFERQFKKQNLSDAVNKHLRPKGKL